MKRILIYGDSNTFGTLPMAALLDDGALPRGARWGDVMDAALGDSVEVVTEGLPGRTTVHDDPVEGAYRNGLRPLRAILESHKPIDLLIFCLGANDTKNRFALNAMDIALGVGRLVREAAALGCVDKILVICPPAVQERGELAAIFEGAEARSVGLPEAMERFAQVNGAAFFDAGSVISVDPLDGVHWSAASHGQLGAAVAAKVQEMLR
ncbi:MAG: SGNH/GDSL hydrolase family protein [Boseongicola sp.]|nr:SGNH/GDSL hydrolase family protein [Boseongicola sp.]NNJ66929.1 SGNH/GDSL hydrolase family protein [Boseongicola sp.]